METANDIIIKIHEESKWVDIKPYSHNIIAINLRILSETHSYTDEQISKIVLSANLHKKGWKHLLK